MSRILSILLASLLLAAAVSACGSDDTGSSSSYAKAAAKTPALAAETAAKGPAPAAETDTGAGVKADIKNFAFAPDPITLKAGQKITWTNSDSAPHTVTAKSGGAKFASGTLEQGATYTWKATKAGTYEYLCAIHPSMVGKITVE